MKILLINNNPVVSRLVSLCVRDDVITFEEVDTVNEADDAVYDIIFIDDASYNGKVEAFLNWVAKTGKVVFLSSRESGDEIGRTFDTVIKKPFLPSQIQSVIDAVREGERVKEEENAAISESTMEIEEISQEDVVEENTSEDIEPKSDEHFIFPLASEDDEPLSIIDEVLLENEEERASEDSGSAPQVLDGKEIEQIKALLEEEEQETLPQVDLEDTEEIEARKIEVITKKLEEDGLEIIGEEEIINRLSKTSKKKQSKKQAKKKKEKKSKEAVYTFEEALLAAIENMKPKKIKKLLKGAEVTIKIRFKDDA